MDVREVASAVLHTASAGLCADAVYALAGGMGDGERLATVPLTTARALAELAALDSKRAARLATILRGSDTVAAALLAEPRRSVRHALLNNPDLEIAGSAVATAVAVELLTLEQPAAEPLCRALQECDLDRVWPALLEQPRSFPLSVGRTLADRLTGSETPEQVRWVLRRGGTPRLLERHLDPTDRFVLSEEEMIAAAPHARRDLPPAQRQLLYDALDASEVCRQLTRSTGARLPWLDTAGELARGWFAHRLYLGRVPDETLTEFTTRAVATGRGRFALDVLLMLYGHPSLAVNADAARALAAYRWTTRSERGGRSWRSIVARTTPAAAEVLASTLTDNDWIVQLAARPGTPTATRLDVARHRGRFELAATVEECETLAATTFSSQLLAVAEQRSGDGFDGWGPQLLSLAVWHGYSDQVRVQTSAQPDAVHQALLARLSNPDVPLPEISPSTGRTDQLRRCLPLDDATVDRLAADVTWRTSLVAVSSTLSLAQLTAAAATHPDVVELLLASSAVDDPVRYQAVLAGVTVGDRGWTDAFSQALTLLHPGEVDVWTTAVAMAAGWSGSVAELVATAARLATSDRGQR